MAVSMTTCKGQRRNFMNLKICPSNDFASKKKADPRKVTV